MSASAIRTSETLTAAEQLRYGREIVALEGKTLETLAEHLDSTFCDAVALLNACRGAVLVSGMGKAGLIGQKISATLASTGTRSHFLHPAEAYHGDLGKIHRDDLLLILSQSGETEEVVRMLPTIVQLGAQILAITASRRSTLGRAARVVLPLGTLDEVCSLGLAPSTSTTAMLALGDALALVASRLRNFRAEDFARFHPGGSLGRKLSKVEQHMRPLAECRVTNQGDTVRQVLVSCAKPGRRSGAIMLTDDDGRLTGIFTDSDLARLFEGRREDAIDRPIAEVMSRGCTTIAGSVLLNDAIELLSTRKFSELPVVDSEQRPLGMLDITDIAGLFPDEQTATSTDTNTSSHGDDHPPATVPFPRLSHD
ncbi:MAG: KpsF/GutQ family sugar-phosphate isomerase [Planctomycetales bacterium]|nr:KpsF/GutQ family sugar-phosphate isomerase [Planctomycetales bacterium]